MSKIICDVCGTRYPDTAEQCPICGHIREADGKTAEDVLIMDDVRTEPHQKVRGGRFSKSNVKKRTQGTFSFEEEHVQEPKPARMEKPVKETRAVKESKPVKRDTPLKETKAAKKAAPGKSGHKDEDIFAEDSQNKKANTVLNILLVIVILALLAVTAYIFTQHVLPGLTKPEPTAAPTVAATEPTEPLVTEEPTYPCDELFLEETDVTLVEYGEKWLINVDVRPANTTDTLTFTSSDEQIATVDSEGCITALAEGECVITIACGNVKVEYPVLCFFPGVDVPRGWEPTEPPPTEPPEEWTVVSKTVVNVRNGPAKDYDRVRQCKNGEKVYVYEIKDVKGVPWGRLEDGWICLSYAKKSE